MDITAKTKDSEPVTVQYEFGDDLAQLVSNFGDAVVYNKALDALVIDAQSNMRRLIKKHKGQDEIQAAISGWKPSAAGGVRKSAAEKVTDLIGKMSAEDKAKLLESLMA